MRFGILFGIAAIGSAFTGSALAYEYQYIARDLPQTVVPQWTPVANQGRAEISDGKLRIEVEAGKRHFYAIGTLNGETEWGDSSAWNMRPGNAKVEIRLRCSSDDPTLEVFRLIIRDGVHQWQIPFSPGRVGKKNVETTDWDTYRITIENGLMELSSDRVGTLLKDGKGQPDQRANALMFGSYFYSKDESPQKRAWEVEFIRWSTKATPSGS